MVISPGSALCDLTNISGIINHFGFHFPTMNYHTEVGLFKDSSVKPLSTFGNHRADGHMKM